MISLNKITLKNGLRIIDDSKTKIIEAACLFYDTCIQAAESCIRKGLLPLKSRGYQLATSLDNPYLPKIKKESLKSKEAQKLITKELLAEAKELLGNGSSKQNDVSSFALSVQRIPEIPSAEEIKMAFNTFSNIFQTRREPIKEIEEVGRFCRMISRGSLNSLKKKVYYLTNAPVNDPFLEYLGNIKNKK